MQAEPPFSWLHGVVIPILFTVFGTVIGFFASQVQDDRRARQAKKAFLRAVGMELDALDVQLDASFREASESAQRVKGGDSTGPRFVGNPRRSVFDGQIGKLRNVDDPMMIEIIHFYSDLAIVEKAFEAANEFGAEYTRTASDVQRPSAQARLLSALRVLQEQISGFRRRLKPLRAKLPSA